MSGTLYEQDKKYILNTYNKLNIEIDRGEGTYLIDKDGNRYLDMFSGIAVNSFGHNNKKILEKIMNQAGKYIHLSNYFPMEPAVKLAKTLVENTFANQVFFTNSGTEANEAVIKIARKFGNNISENKTKILTAYNSFHGRTMGSLSLTGQEKYQKGFEPLMPDVEYFEYNNIKDFESKVDENVCAVFLEIIQGEGGIVTANPEFLEKIEMLSSKYNFLLVIDEIQTGIARTGKFLAVENYNIKPHIVTLAKSLGGGLPIGAVLVSKKAENVLSLGEHGTTFAPNPVSCAAGLEVLNNALCEVFLYEIKDKSKYLITKLKELQKKYPSIIEEIRGVGLMLGIDVGEYAGIIKEKSFENKLLLNVTAGTIIRLLPVLTITYEEICQFIKMLESILEEI